MATRAELGATNCGLQPTMLSNYSSKVKEELRGGAVPFHNALHAS